MAPKKGNGGKSPLSPPLARSLIERPKTINKLLQRTVYFKRRDRENKHSV